MIFYILFYFKPSSSFYTSTRQYNIYTKATRHIINTLQFIILYDNIDVQEVNEKKSTTSFHEKKFQVFHLFCFCKRENLLFLFLSISPIVSKLARMTQNNNNKRHIIYYATENSKQ